MFAQYQGEFGAHDLQASLRRDDNDQFGGQTTGGIAWGMGFGEGWRVTASHATAFKAPSFNELYFPFFGNPALRPETSRSSELGAGRAREGWQWQLDAYQTRIDDLIAYDTAIFPPNNIEQARIRGARTDRQRQRSAPGRCAARWATWMRATSAPAQPGKRLPRRAAPQRAPRPRPRRRRVRLRHQRHRRRRALGRRGQHPAGGWLRHAGCARVVALRQRLDPAGQPGQRVRPRYETSAYYRQPGRELA